MVPQRKISSGTVTDSPVLRSSNPRDLSELDRPELANFLAGLGFPRFHAGQIFRWIYRRGVTDTAEMTDLSRDLRAALKESTHISSPLLQVNQKSTDGTQKFLLSLSDDRQIESVFIPDTPAQTFCISTQVGCAMACRFCLTGKMGLARNLTAGEIVGQVRVLAGALAMHETPFNIVLMGMGEPLHNYDETMKALRILADEQGFGISPRRITLSTVGLLPQLERLTREPLMPNLAISLHAPTDAQRAEIVPLNRKYGIAALVDACKRIPLRRRQRITFEYVLLAGVNDRPDDARRLARVLAGTKSKVNLIPLNEAPGIPYERPSDSAVSEFARILSDHDLVVQVRKSRGRDIRAACGQLIVEGERKSTAQRLAAVIS